MNSMLAVGALALLGACATVPSARSMQDGAWVLAEWEDGQFYPGVLKSRSGGVYQVTFDDGTEATLRNRQIRPYDWQIGTVISCQLVDGEMTTVSISTMGPSTTDLGVVDDVGTRTATNTGRCRAL